MERQGPSAEEAVSLAKRFGKFRIVAQRLVHTLG